MTLSAATTLLLIFLSMVLLTGCADNVALHAPLVKEDMRRLMEEMQIESAHPTEYLFKSSTVDATQKFHGHNGILALSRIEMAARKLGYSTIPPPNLATAPMVFCHPALPARFVAVYPATVEMPMVSIMVVVSGWKDDKAMCGASR